VQRIRHLERRTSHKFPPSGHSSAFPDTPRDFLHVTPTTRGDREKFSELRGTVHPGRIPRLVTTQLASTFFAFRTPSVTPSGLGTDQRAREFRKILDVSEPGREGCRTEVARGVIQGDRIVDRFEALTDPASLQQLDKQDHNHHDQEQMHQISRDAETQAQSPHQQQNQDDRPQHKSPFSESAYFVCANTADNSESEITTHPYLLRTRSP
jgi:hypothetical protein